MRTTARSWRRALHRIVSLADKPGDPVDFYPPRWSEEEMTRHFAFIEASRGFRLPPSYKEFLSEFDGCHQLFRGAALFSVAQLLDPTHANAADDAIEDLNTPIPSFVTPVQPHWRRDGLICIGLDAAGDVVFVLDPASVRDDGEMDVVAWFSGLGVRLPSFMHLLDFIGDLMDTRDDVCAHGGQELSAIIAA
jgi:hypothetical protein